MRSLMTVVLYLHLSISGKDRIFLKNWKQFFTELSQSWSYDVEVRRYFSTVAASFTQDGICLSYCVSFEKIITYDSLLICDV